jgi:radical SAM family RiPP maturation amino acid epimerase
VLHRSSGKPPPPNPAVAAHRACLDGRAGEERSRLAQVKRLLERYRGDPVFRQAADAGGDSFRDAVARLGMAIDPVEVRPLLRPDLDKRPHGEGGTSLARSWADYAAEMRTLERHCRQLGSCAEVNSRFDAWRRRQMRRCDSEMEQSADIVHAVLAFELSAGCSVGCWFCAVSAERFRGNFPHSPGNARLWREMLAVAAELFGPAVQTGFCYGATDPCDNPDYADFLEDYRIATGIVPPTTTAIPLRDIGLTRRILALDQAHGCFGNRFSILNLKLLDRVHAEFTADELFHVKLILQNPEATTPRVLAGRALTRRPAAHAEAEAKRGVENSTIECVSGFFVNMVDRTVRLVTPVPASERWPLGYRTFETRGFTTASDFKTTVNDMIARHMPSAPRPNVPVRFRDDLLYCRTADGFVLKSRGTRFALAGGTAVELGELIDRGECTPVELRAALIDAGADIFVIADLIQQLFDNGLLDDSADEEEAVPVPEANRAFSTAAVP